MSVTRADMVTELAQRLGDSGFDIWTSAELEDYIQDGYDRLVEETRCLWDTDVLPDYAAAFSYTEPWELDYFTSEFMVSGRANHTAVFERDYIPDSRGPANHNQHWEYNDSHVTTTLCDALADLPADFLELERATWNNLRLETLRSRLLGRDDSRYELTTGDVDAYLMDKDGLNVLRKWRVPAAAYDPYDFDATSDGWGIIRDWTDIVDDLTSMSAAWGDTVAPDGLEVFGNGWGILGPVYTETRAVRIEYRKRGHTLELNQPFEIPDRYTVYVRHYAQAKALDREGKGQDLELAAFYMSRYEAGVERMKERRRRVESERMVVMGSRDMPAVSRGPRLPWNYGEVVR